MLESLISPFQGQGCFLHVQLDWPWIYCTDLETNISSLIKARKMVALADRACRYPLSQWPLHPPGSTSMIDAGIGQCDRGR